MDYKDETRKTYDKLAKKYEEKFPQVLQKIKIILKPNGVFGLAMKEGVGEDFKFSDKDNSSQRWFSLYSNKELKKYLTDLNFEILFSSRSVVRDDQMFLNYLCRKL